jgi:nitrous oxide reductase accessory protein NosL
VNRVTLAVLGCVLLIGVAGCGKPEDVGPPEIRFGQDTCHACGMIVDDDRYAAAVVTVTDGGAVEPRVFDDVGEMLEFAPPAGARDVRRYVRDAATRQWVDAARATFAKPRGLHTPMGTGIAAYADAAAARAALDASGGGEILAGVPTTASAGVR